MRAPIRTIQDQGEHLRNIVLKHGIGSKRLDIAFRKFCMFWLDLGTPADAFDRAEMDSLRSNYEWVCTRLKELEVKNEG